MNPEKTAKQVASLLMMAYNHTVPDQSANDLLSNPLTKELFSLANTMRPGPSGKRFRLGSKALKAIGKAARTRVPLMDFYPLENCCDKLSEFVVEELDVNTPRSHVHDRLRQRVLTFLNTFDSQGEWEIVLAVRNIARNDLPFTVGITNFYEMNDEQFSRWGRRYLSGQYHPKDDIPLYQGWMHQQAAFRLPVPASASKTRHHRHLDQRLVPSQPG